MKTRIQYNKNFDVLMIQINDLRPNKNEEINNITVLKNDSTICGINIFNPKIKKENHLLIDFELFEYAKNELKGIVELEYEKQFVICEILEHEQIPNTHLNICKVNLGEKIQQIICGAKNVKKGLKTICATLGSFMPDGTLIKEGKLMNVDSFGMLCSSKELNLEKYNFNETGIVELGDNYKVGSDFFEVLKKQSKNYNDLEIYALKDGDIINPNEPVLKITGLYTHFAFLEGMIDSILSRASGIATSSKQIVDSANGKVVLNMNDRSDFFLNQELDGYASYIGVEKPQGTMPHALIQSFNGDLVEACKAYVNTFPENDLVALVDYNNDCITDSLKVAKEFGQKLKYVRLDTSQALVDKSLSNISNARDVNGVCVMLVELLREELDDNGFEHVKIIVSSGFDANKIKNFESKKAPVDVYGVGEAITKRKISFTGDAVLLNEVLAFMFKKKNKDKDLIIGNGDNLNHWSFDNDPYLNVEPVFSHEAPPTLPNGDKIESTTTKTLKKGKKNEDVSAKIAKLSAQRNKNNSQFNVESNNPLSNIIGAARNRNVDMQQELIENDPVIARLAKIEELRRTGGNGDELKADLSKSNLSTGFAARAKDFNEKNNVKPVDYSMARLKKLKNADEAVQENTFHLNKKALIEKTISLHETKNKSSKSEKILELENKIQEKIKKLEEYKMTLLEKEIKKHVNELEKITNENKVNKRSAITASPELTLTKLDLKLEREIAKIKMKQ
ncbi:hypothetical protein FQR65_LT17091 [Abscondita terminalis]|nr:hypothetical protein FQR65_LT17091 [Abscondita terminalis]